VSEYIIAIGHWEGFLSQAYQAWCLLARGIDTGLVFTTRTGRPVEPRNLVRSFMRICQDSKVRRIRVHALRHTTASLLKDLGVPARDAPIILGHSHITTTQQIYTHVDEVARRDALTKLNKLLGGTE
jgi:integrase